MATRLARNTIDGYSLPNVIAMVADMNRPTESVLENEKPPIQRCYFEHFNSIDMFDSRKASVEYQPKVYKEDVKVLVSVLELVIVQSYSWFASYRYLNNPRSRRVELHNFKTELYWQLMTRYGHGNLRPRHQ